MPCSVCAHAEAPSINASLATRTTPVLTLAKTHSLSRDALNYHRRAHLPHELALSPQLHPNARAAVLSRSRRPTPSDGAQTGTLDYARERFLKAYAACGNVTAACKRAGIGRTTFYRWQEHDEDFVLAFKQADLQATESLEKEAWRRAREGFAEPVYQHGKEVGTIQRYSDALLMFLLKARAPERYRDRVDVSVTPVIKAVAGFDPSDVL